MSGAWKRTVYNIGSGEGNIEGVEVSTEDSMLSLIAETGGGEEVTVFVDMALFPQMREKMDIIERPYR